MSDPILKSRAEARLKLLTGSIRDLYRYSPFRSINCMARLTSMRFF